MAMPTPASFPKFNPLLYAPSGMRLRDIMHDHGGSKSDMQAVADTVNHLLCEMRPRCGGCVFAGDLKWTDNDAAVGYVAANEVDWRQPFSQGMKTVRYRLRVNATAGRTGYIRIKGANGVWRETNFAGGSWQTIDVADVDLTGAGAAQYFTPIIQGKLDATGIIQVRTMGWTEDPLTTVPLTGIDGVTGLDTTHDITADLPLSAELLEEVTRALLWCLDKRTRALVQRISTDGTGAHPNNAWTSAAVAYDGDFADINDTAVVGRAIALVDYRLNRSLQMHVKAKSDGTKTGYFRTRTRHNASLPALELNWTNVENTLSWKSTSGRLTKDGDTSWGLVGTEMQYEVKSDLVVARVGIWADETSFAF